MVIRFFRLSARIRWVSFRFNHFINQEHATWGKKRLAQLGRYLKVVVDLFKGTVQEFARDGAFRHGAALSYYAIFSLPPMLIVIISALGVFFNEQDVRGEVLVTIQDLFGSNSADQIIFIMDNLQRENEGGIATLVGLGTLIFTSTAVFYALQNSLNLMWHITPHIKKNLKDILIDRLLSFLMVVTLGLFLILSLFVETMVLTFDKYFKLFRDEISKYLNEEMIPDVEFITDVVYWVNFGVSLSITAFLFVCIFKFLPDAIIRWKDAWVGAFFTATLFVLGKIGIGWYISDSDFNVTYGAASSLIIILVWVFYSSQILFFGAEFTYVYSLKHGKTITASKFSNKWLKSKG